MLSSTTHSSHLTRNLLSTRGQSNTQSSHLKMQKPVTKIFPQKESSAFKEFLLPIDVDHRELTITT